jgi:hypothetical protein
MKLILSLLLAALVPAATGTATVNLGGAGDYAILAKTGISTVPDSTIIGDIAVSPIAATAMTGFSLALDGEGMHASSSQVQGKAYAADNVVPTPGVLTAAVVDMQAAYVDAGGRTTTDLARINFKGGLIGGETLTPGVYDFKTAITIATDIFLVGGPNDVFIIKTTGVLTLATNTKVLLSGGVQAKNVFWWVAGNTAIGAGALMKGVILCATDVLFATGSSLTGRILAQTAVALQKAQITEAKVDGEGGPAEAGLNFGGVCDYAIVSKAGITNVPDSTIVGNLGVSPITAASMTGFGLEMGSDGQHSTSSQVTGVVRAANYGGQIAADLTTAVSAMEAAYTDASSRFSSDATHQNIGNGNIGGRTFTPGVYTWTVGIRVTTDMYFEGGPNDVFIMQTTGVLSTAVGIKVILKGGAVARNVIWQVAGNVAIGAAAEMQGVILCKTDVVFVTGSSIVGAVFAQTAVALQKATITAPPGGLCAVNAVPIGHGAYFAILSEECIKTYGTATITGNLGVSPFPATAIEGFDMTLDSSGEFSTGYEFSGKAFAGDGEGPVREELTLATSEVRDAYNDAMARYNTDPTKKDIKNGAIGGLTLSPGVYTFTDASVGVTIDTDIILEGGEDDVFIIQTNGSLAIAANIEVILSSGVMPKNVFWQVAGDVLVGGDAEFQGVLLSQGTVLFKDGSSLEGRVLSQGCVTLESMVVVGTTEAFCA